MQVIGGGSGLRETSGYPTRGRKEDAWRLGTGMGIGDAGNRSCFKRSGKRPRGQVTRKKKRQSEAPGEEAQNGK